MSSNIGPVVPLSISEFNRALEPPAGLEREYSDFLSSAERYYRALMGSFNNPVEIILWEITRRCNLRCEHCGSPTERTKGDELSSEQALALFEKIKRETDLSELRVFGLTGGEPFLRKDLLQILQGLTDIGYRELITIQTNGHYLFRHPELLPSLLNIGIVGLGVNLDGVEEVHNAIRNDSRSFSMVTEVIDKITNHRDQLDLTINTLVTPESVKEIHVLAEFIRRVNPYNWRFLIADPIGRIDQGSMELSPDWLRGLFIWVRDLSALHYANDYPVNPHLGCFGWTGMPLVSEVSSGMPWHCLAGVCLMGVTHDGKITGCTNSDREFIVGDGLKQDVGQLWEKGFEFYRTRQGQTFDGIKCTSCKEFLKGCGGSSFHLVSKKKQVKRCMHHRLHRCR